MTLANINPAYEPVLEGLPEAIPTSFRLEAARAAELFTLLEDEKPEQDLSEGVQYFATALTSSGFITYGQIPELRGVDVSAKYPEWVNIRRKPLTLERDSMHDQEEAVTAFFEEYFRQYGTHIQALDGQSYYSFGESRGVSKTKKNLLHNAKLYVSEQELSKIGATKAVLDRLAESDLHPSTIKHFELSNLVMYWDSGLTREEACAVQEEFQEQGMESKGPAQDSFIVSRSEDGGLKYILHLSNDSGLGHRNPFQWREKTYNQAAFFAQWLRLCFGASKKPNEPYRLSFVRAKVPEGEDSERFLDEVVRNDTAGLPVIGFTRPIAGLDVLSDESWNEHVVGVLNP